MVRVVISSHGIDELFGDLEDIDRVDRKELWGEILYWCAWSIWTRRGVGGSSI